MPQKEVITDLQGHGGVYQEQEKTSVITDSYVEPQEPVASSDMDLPATGNTEIDGQENIEQLTAEAVETATLTRGSDADKIDYGAGGSAVIPTQLMGLEGMFDPADMGDNRYTDEELQLLREQLERYPPEVAVEMKPSADGDTCSLCWTFIYRPLIKANKL